MPLCVFFTFIVRDTSNGELNIVLVLGENSHRIFPPVNTISKFAQPLQRPAIFLLIVVSQRFLQPQTQEIRPLPFPVINILFYLHKNVKYRVFNYLILLRTTSPMAHLISWYRFCLVFFFFFLINSVSIMSLLSLYKER